MSLTLSPAQHLSVCVMPSNVCSVLRRLASLVLLLQPGGGRQSLPLPVELWMSLMRVAAGSVAHCNLLELYSEQLLGLGFDGAYHLSDGSNCRHSNVLKA